MRLRLFVLLLGFVIMIALVPAPAAHAAPASVFQPSDTDVPPGNPVIGSDRPGDIDDANSTNYLLWTIVAACLIGAGVLLVKVERWEARRIDA